MVFWDFLEIFIFFILLMSFKFLDILDFFLCFGGILIFFKYFFLDFVDFFRFVEILNFFGFFGICWIFFNHQSFYYKLPRLLLNTKMA